MTWTSPYFTAFHARGLFFSVDNVDEKAKAASTPSPRPRTLSLSDTPRSCCYGDDARNGVKAPQPAGRRVRVGHSYYNARTPPARTARIKIRSSSQQGTSTVGRLQQPAVVVALVGLAPFCEISGPSLPQQAEGGAARSRMHAAYATRSKNKHHLPKCSVSNTTWATKGTNRQSSMTSNKPKALRRMILGDNTPSPKASRALNRLLGRSARRPPIRRV